MSYYVDPRSNVPPIPSISGLRVSPVNNNSNHSTIQPFNHFFSLGPQDCKLWLSSNSNHSAISFHHFTRLQMVTYKSSVHNATLTSHNLAFHRKTTLRSKHSYIARGGSSIHTWTAYKMCSYNIHTFLAFLHYTLPKHDNKQHKHTCVTPWSSPPLL